MAKPRGLVLIFILCALPTGLGCALFTPIGMFPDEQAHIVRADGLRHGQIFGLKPPPSFSSVEIGAGVPFDQGLQNIINIPEYVELFPKTASAAAIEQQAENIHWGTASYWPTQMVQYFPIFYVPAALGLFTGQIFNLHPLNSLYLGRVAVLLAFIIIGALALAYARFGGALFFAALTLPTTVNLASSYNEDGLIAAACILVASLLTRCRPGFGASWFAALTVLSCVLSAKIPYVPLLAFCVLPMFSFGIWRRIGFTLLFSLPAALWLLHTWHSGFISTSFMKHYHPGPLWPGPRNIWLDDTQPQNHLNNVKVLLAHPAEIVRLPVTSLILLWHATWPGILGMIGKDYGRIYPWEYPCLAMSLGIAALSALRGRLISWSLLDGGLAMLALFGTFICLELSLYITFTATGWPLIIGVQSRYFLPFIPFFVFIFAWTGGLIARLPKIERLPSISPGWFCLPAISLAIINTVALPLYIFHVYR